MLKLPLDVKSRNDAAKQATQTLDQDLVEKKSSVPYSNKSFLQASIEWLVATDQVNLVSFLF